MPQSLAFNVSTEGYQETTDTFTSMRTAFAEGESWIIGVGAEYGAYVEFGTSRMKAKPYLFPAARYVMRTKFPVIQAKAMAKSNPIEYLVASLALNIEREAKKRAPVKTGNLMGSIKAVPASALG